eukprot:gene11666-24436_t
MHNHLKFLNHTEVKLDVSFPTIGDFSNADETNNEDNRPSIQKHADIVDYLQISSRDQRVTVGDILRDCQVDLEGKDSAVLDMLKINPKVDVLTIEGIVFFQYRSKFEIRNKYELLNAIDRIRSGISWKDIEDCYPNIQMDIQEMIMSGQIIAIKNKETRMQIFYPRQRSFLTKLSGDIIAIPNDIYVATKEDIRHEIRRGDAIQINNSWFRVSSNIYNSKLQQPERARAPLSVSSTENLSERNEYIEEYTAKKIPLDGEYDGDNIFTGVALKHGCTNDLRDKWKLTLESMKSLKDEKSLEAELLKLHLITKTGVNGIKRFANSDKNTTKKRARRVSTKITNTHLKGTIIGDIIASTPEYE